MGGGTRRLAATPSSTQTAQVFGGAGTSLGSASGSSSASDPRSLPPPLSSSLCLNLLKLCVAVSYRIEESACGKLDCQSWVETDAFYTHRPLVTLFSKAIQLSRCLCFGRYRSATQRLKHKRPHKGLAMSWNCPLDCVYGVLCFYVGASVVYIF